LWPDYKQGLSNEWWAQSGLCTANPPDATANEELWAFWKVTYDLPIQGVGGGCGDGVSITAMREAAAKKNQSAMDLPQDD
jgi:hypothetical protein